jgi:hypothetical protein
MRILTLLFCLFTAFVNAQSADPKVISGTVLLNSKTTPDFKKIIADLKTGMSALILSTYPTKQRYFLPLAPL